MSKSFKFGIWDGDGREVASLQVLGHGSGGGEVIYTGFSLS